MMCRKIISTIIGELQQEHDFPDCWRSGEIEIPFFNNKKLTITFTSFEPEKDKEFIAEADQALTNFLKLSAEDRNAISILAYKNCMEFLEEFDLDEADEPLRNVKDPNEIWGFIQPTEIYIRRRPYNEQDVYVQVACECDWEQEHGLQFVFRQGRKLTRISGQDGHLTEADAYDKPDEEDELLSVF